MKDEDGKENKEAPPVFSRRKFLRGCGITVFTTAVFEAISILSDRRDAEAQKCGSSCTSACVTSCTSCTTVNCMSGNVPPPSPPKCVQGFKN